MDDVVLVGVDRYIPDVVLVRENQPRCYIIFAFAGVFVALSLVKLLVTFAIVTAGGVGAVLGAHSGRF